MKFPLSIFLITVNCMVLCSAPNPQCLQAEYFENPPIKTLHDIGPNAAVALSQATQSIERSTTNLREISQNSQLPGISTRNALRYIGVVATCAGIISIAVSGQMNDANRALVSSGLIALGATECIGLPSKSNALAQKITTAEISTQTEQPPVNNQDEVKDPAA